MEHDKNVKQQDSSDLQIIEEMSSSNNIFIKPLTESIESNSDLDLSLRQLINQMSFDYEMSLTDLIDQ